MDGTEEDHAQPGEGEVQPFNAAALTQNSSSLMLIDHLSGLFSMINNVCQEQFDIIQKVFPANEVARVTRLLIQRIFNDPAFGIQARVDSILVPQPPRPQLPLADYLDALVTVREKLSALNLMLIEYCSHPAMKGVGSEAVTTRHLKYRGGGGGVRKGWQGRENAARGVDGDEDDIHDEGGESHFSGPIEIDEGVQADAELRDFFDDQVLEFRMD